MGRKIVALLIVAALAIGGLISCKGATTSASYKIGVLAAQTGIYGGLGLQSLEGVQLIVDEINQGGGINGVPLELVVYDDKSEATEAVRLANKLIEVDEVHVIVAGTNTGLSNALIPVANENEIPIVILSGTALVDDQLGAWIFRPMGAEWDYIILNFNYLGQNLEVVKCASLIENSGYGQGGDVFLPQLSSDFNLTIVETQYFDPGVTDVSPQLTKIKNSEAEAIFVWGSSPTASIAVKQAREMGIGLPIVATPPQAAPNMVAEFGEYYEMEPAVIAVVTKLDVWEQLPGDDIDKAKCGEFAELYVETCGHPPAMWNVLGAQMLLFIEDGLKRANADPDNVVETRDKLRDAMESTEELDLPTGVYTLSPTDHYGSVRQKMAVVTFSNGQLVFLQ